MKLPLPFVILLALSVGSCATSSDVIPAGKGRGTVTTSLGGPLTKLKSTIVPAPMIAVRGTYGINENTDASLTLHGTTLLFGLLGLEAAGKYFPLAADGWQPSLGLTAGALVFSSVRPAVDRMPRIFPLFGTTAAWPVGPGHAYLGADVLFSTYPYEYTESAPSYTWAPFIGYRWDPENGWVVTSEIKKFAANWRTDQVAVDFYSVDWTGLKTRHPQNGAIGLLIAVTRRLEWLQH